MALLVWLILVAAEQTLPATWRDRSPDMVAVRATAAVLVALWASCSLVARTVLVCR